MGRGKRKEKRTRKKCSDEGCLTTPFRLPRMYSRGEEDLLKFCDPARLLEGFFRPSAELQPERGEKIGEMFVLASPANRTIAQQWGFGGHFPVFRLFFPAFWGGRNREEHSMGQDRSRLKLSENFERHWSTLISGETHMDQSLVHTFSWGNSHGPMVLKVLLKFPPTLVLVHGWLFSEKPTLFRCFFPLSGRTPENPSLAEGQGRISS